MLAVFTLVYITLRTGDRTSALGSFGDKIGVVDLEGVIITPSVVVPQLKKFADDDSIKAIILHVNSPGGGVAASEEIYREVKRIRDDKKKRIVLLDTGIIPLCGAGVHSAKDVVAARKLGCKGVLIASAIAAVPLKQAEKTLREIAAAGVH